MKRKNLVCGAVVLLTVVTAIGVSGCQKKGEEVVAPVETIEAVVETTEADPEFNWMDMNVPEVFDVEMIEDSVLLAEPRASADRLQPVFAGDIFPVHFNSRGLGCELDADYYGTELADGTIGYLNVKSFERVIVDEADMEDVVLSEAESMEETAVSSSQAENSNVKEETFSPIIESQVTAEIATAVSKTKDGVSGGVAVQQ